MSENVDVDSNVSETKNENEVVENKEEGEAKKLNLLEIEVTNENTALNVLIGFLNIAQKRGAFAINESSKIHECIKVFMRK
jgi:hypothetical protein